MPRGRQETAGQSAWHESHMACRPGKTPQTSPNHPEEILCPTICYVFYICIYIYIKNIVGISLYSCNLISKAALFQSESNRYCPLARFPSFALHLSVFPACNFWLGPFGLSALGPVGHLAIGICVYIWYNYEMYNSHMQVCHFAQRRKLPYIYIYICIVIVSLCFISWHVRLGEWSFSTWCKVDGMLMDTSLWLLKCIGMPCCEFGLACANTSKSLQTWYGSWLKFLFVTSLMQLDNLARASPICTYFPNPSMRCSEIQWFQMLWVPQIPLWHRDLFSSSLFSKLDFTQPPFVEEATEKSSVAQTSGYKSQKESQAVQSTDELVPFLLHHELLAFKCLHGCLELPNLRWRK